MNLKFYINSGILLLLLICISYAEQEGKIVSGTASEPCNFVWSSQLSGITTVLNTIKAVNEQVGWAAGSRGIVIRTTDGGENWITVGTFGQINGTVFCMDAVDANNAWVSTTPFATHIYKTSNGGANWIQVFSQTNGFINGIQMLNASTGYACGDPVGGVWTLLKTTNGGDNWEQIPTAPPQYNSEYGFNNTFEISGSNMWFATNNTQIYGSTNLGTNWISYLTPGLTYVFTLHFNNDTFGIVSGSTALKTTNSGNTWEQITGTIPGIGDMFGAEGFGSEYFWVLRDSNIFVTSNGGANWNTVTGITPTGILYAIDFAMNAGCPSGWVVSNNGSIYAMKTVTGINNTNNNIPTYYSLEQNYPNPFNPITIINYQLPNSSDVKIVIFDVMGREVAVLVDKKQSAGTYEVEWDAANYPSGVYFYKIDAGAFVEAKKMMLIK